MKIKLVNVLGSFLLILFLSSCSPSVLDVTLYTTDIEAANEGEVFEVPVRASFTMYSDDDGELETASAIAEKYLAPDSVFSQSSGDWGETLVIETTIPIGTLDNLQNYLANNNRVAVLLVENNGEIVNGDSIAFVELYHILENSDFSIESEYDNIMILIILKSYNIRRL